MLLGRQPELDILNAGLERALTGKPHVIMLEGQPGLGKTTLVEHFMQSFPSDLTHLACTARCHDIGMQAEPLQPIIQAVGESVRHANHDDPLVQRVLSSKTFNTIAEVTAVMPWLNYASAGMKLAQIYLRKNQPSPPREKRNTSSALLDFVIESAQTLPVVLFLDDLHWADPHTLQWFADLLSKCHQADDEVRLLVIVTVRQLEREQNKALQGTLERMDRDGMRKSKALDIIRLKGLDQRSTNILTQRTLEGYPVGPPTFVEWLSEYSGGIPLVIIDTLHALHQENFFIQKDGKLEFIDPPLRLDGRWKLGSRLGVWLEGSKDATQRAVSSSLRTLGARVREVLELASTMTTVIYSRLLAEVLDMDELELMRHFDHLVRAGFLQEVPRHIAPLPEPTATFRFITNAHRDAVKGKLNTHTRRLMHGKLAACLSKHLTALQHHHEELELQVEALEASQQGVHQKLDWRLRQAENQIEELRQMLVEHHLGHGARFEAAVVLYDIAWDWTSIHIFDSAIRDEISGSMKYARLLEMAQRIEKLLADVQRGPDNFELEAFLELEGKTSILLAEAWSGLDRRDLAQKFYETAYTRGCWISNNELLVASIRGLCVLHGDANAVDMREVRGRLLNHLNILSPEEFRELLEFSMESDNATRSIWLEQVSREVLSHGEDHPFVEEIENVRRSDEIEARLNNLFDGLEEEVKSCLEWIESQLEQNEDTSWISIALGEELESRISLLASQEAGEFLVDINELGFQICSSVQRVETVASIQRLYEHDTPTETERSNHPEAYLTGRILAMQLGERKRLESLVLEARDALDEDWEYLDHPDGLEVELGAALDCLERHLTTEKLHHRFEKLLARQFKGDRSTHDAHLVWEYGLEFVELDDLEASDRRQLLKLMRDNPILLEADHMSDMAWFESSSPAGQTIESTRKYEQLVLEHWQQLSPFGAELASGRLSAAWEDHDIDRHREWLERYRRSKSFDVDGLAEEQEILQQLQELAAAAGDLDSYRMLAESRGERDTVGKGLGKGVRLIHEATLAWGEGEERRALELMSKAYDAFSTPVGLGLIDDLCDLVIDIHRDVIREHEINERGASVDYHIKQIVTAYRTAIRVCRQTEQWHRVLEEYDNFLDFLTEFALYDEMEGAFEEAIDHALERESTMWLTQLGHWIQMEMDTYSELAEDDEEGDDFFERVVARLEKLDAKLQEASTSLLQRLGVALAGD